MRKINILYVINKLAIGGAERQIIELLKGLDKSKFNSFLVYLERCGKFTGNVKTILVKRNFYEK